MRLCPLLFAAATALGMITSSSVAQVAMRISDDTQLLPRAVLDVIRPEAQEFLSWAPLVGPASHAAPDKGTQAAMGASVAWMKRVLKAEWIPSEVQSFALARQRAVLGLPPGLTTTAAKYDAVGIRYQFRESAVQIVQTTYLLGIVIVPDQADLNGTLKPDPASFARHIIKTYFLEAERLLHLSGEEHANADGVSVGRPTGDSLSGWSNQWYESLFWFTDGKVFARLSHP